MIEQLTMIEAAYVAALALAGLVFGLGYFRLVRWSVSQFSNGGHWLAPTVLTLGRIAAAVGLLALAAQLGAGPLLGAFIGFLLARTIALRGARRTG